MTKQMNVPKLRFGEFQGGWSKISIDGLNIDVIDGDRGTHYPTKEELLSEGSCLFLSAKNVTKSGFQFSEKQFITEEKDKLLRKGKLKRGDIVLTTRGSVGHKALYAETVGFDSLRINSGMVLLRHQWEELSNDFVYNSMFTRHFTKQIDVVAFGSAQPALTVKEIKKLKLSIPPSFHEQQKIASFLSKVDEKIALLTEKKAKLTEYKKGVMQQLFDGKWQEQDGKLVFVPPTLRFKADDGSELPDWEERALIELAAQRFSNGVFNDPKRIGKGYRLINVKDMYSGNFIDTSTLSLLDLSEKEFSNNQVKYGDIFFTRSSLVPSGIAYSNVNLSNDNDITYDGHLIKFSPKLDMISPYYFANYLRSHSSRKSLISRGKQSTMTTIGQEDIKDIRFLIPSLEEQIKIANFLSAIDQKIDLANSELEKAKEWKKGLLQQMFV